MIEQKQGREVSIEGDDDVIHKEFINGDPKNWLIQWRQKRNWKLKTPMIKECKKRKEAYSSVFEDTYYKSPYKYHINLCCDGMDINEPVIVQLALNFENGENITGTETSVLTNGTNEVKVQKFEKTTYSSSLEVTVGSFQYNVCSFRHDGRKFRIVLHLFSNYNNSPILICSIISPPFTIRAKKPIKNPGTRGKRKRADSKAKTNPKKKRKYKRRTKKNPIQNEVFDVDLKPMIQPQLKVKTNNVMGMGQPQFFSHKNQNIHIVKPTGNQLSVNPTLISAPSQNDPLKLENRQKEANMFITSPPSPSGFPKGGITPSGFSEYNFGGTEGAQIDMFDFLLSEQEEQEPLEMKQIKERSNDIVQQYSSMNSEKRIALLSRMLEVTYPTELEYIRAIFFPSKEKKETNSNPQIFNDMDKLLDDNFSI